MRPGLGAYASSDIADDEAEVWLVMAAEGTNRTYNHIGLPDSFHPVSHHANDPERIAKLVKIQTWHVEKFAEFLANEVPGVVVPKSILKRMQRVTDKDAAREEGLAIARETLAEIRPLVQGVQVSAPFGRVQYALDVFSVL